MQYRVEVYDQTSQPGNDPTGRLAILENAFNKKVEKELNRAGSFSFSLPLTDPKAQYLVERNHVKVFHSDDPVPTFDGRIMPWDKQMDEEGKEIANVTCEGFATVLIDNIWPGQVEFPHTTPQSFYSAVLAKQSKITLGTIEPVVDFYPQFSYDNLMFMLWKVPSIIGGDIEVDTMRQLNHRNEQGQDLGVRIEYGFNMKSIDVKTDPSNLVTRLYGLGSAEGVNQVTIKSVNGGKEYIDADTQGLYGIVEDVYTDKQITDPGTLMLKMQQVLAVNKNPYKTFSVSAAWLAELTGYEHTAFGLGDWLIIRHVDLGIDTKMRVVKINQDWDYPENITLEFGSRTRDLSDELSKIKSKQGTWDRFPQGAPNLYVVREKDNVDVGFPLTLRFPIPPQALKTTRVPLSLRGLKARYFSQTAGASTATTTGASSKVTSDASSKVTSDSEGSHYHFLFGSDNAGQTLPYKIGLYYDAGAGTYIIGTDCPAGSVGDKTTGFPILGHNHGMAHNHGMDHNHNMQHTHTQTAGVFEGTTYPRNITLTIDGVDQTALLTTRGDGNSQISIDELDIAPYLNSGQYVHTVDIGSDEAGLLDVWVIPQVYIQSA
jgi:phage minor structural protein